jgi:hypothetical protein
LSDWIYRERRESHQKRKEERKLLDDSILTTNNYDFDVYGFIFKRETQ